MRRAIAMALLFALGLFLAGAGWDTCDSDAGGCPPVCHLGCSDGCTSAPAGEWLALAIGSLGSSLIVPPVPTADPFGRSATPEISPPRA